MNYQTVIQYFGNPSNLARALGIKPQAVYQWAGNIPVTRQYQIEVVTNGEIKVNGRKTDLA